MNRRELVRAVAAHTAADPKQVDATLAGMTDVITAVVSKGEPVSIPGFAKFTKVNRPARMARNPQTGEQVHVKAKTVAKASAMKAFRDTVMSPAKAPRLAKGVWPTDPNVLTRQAQDRKVQTSSGPTRRAAGAVASKRGSAAKKTVRKGATKKAARRSSARR
jgi:DNA-binding protein HU-beta